MMQFITKEIAVVFAIAVLLFTVSCGGRAEAEKPSSVEINTASPTELSRNFQPPAQPSPAMPNLQAEITDDRFKTTNSELGKFDFRNNTYPMPRGWQHPDGKEITLENGKVKPIEVPIEEDMSNEEKAARRAARRIGLSYVTTRYFDVNGDGNDEAIVILKVETGGHAIPQIVYIYEWQNAAPELIWYFRTGDRADGGLKDLRMENGLLTVELFGQDRFLLGEVETSKITGDEEQICCPTFFTRTQYKWNGRNFQMQGKRLTYEMTNLSKPPLENFGDIMNDPVKSRKYLEGKSVSSPHVSKGSR